MFSVDLFAVRILRASKLTEKCYRECTKKTECQMCGVFICEVCKEKCSICHEDMCKKCKKTCFGCGMEICDHCSTICASCKMYFCDKCLEESYKSMCDECLELVCPECIVDNGRGTYCKLCLSDIEVCQNDL